MRRLRSCGSPDARSDARDERPEVVGPAPRDQMAEPDRPLRLVAELVAPGPKPARGVVQRVIIGETHRTGPLVSDSRHGRGGLAPAYLCRLDTGALPGRPRPH